VDPDFTSPAPTRGGGGGGGGGFGRGRGVSSTDLQLDGRSVAEDTGRYRNDPNRRRGL